MKDHEFLYEQVFTALIEARPGERGTTEHGEPGAAINFDPAEVLMALINVLASYAAQTSSISEHRSADHLADTIRNQFKDSYEYFRAQMLMRGAPAGNS